MFAVSLPRTLNSCATVKKSRCNWWAFHYFCKNKKRNRRVGSVISSTLSHFELFLQEQRMLVTNGGTETLPNSKQPLSKVQTKHNTRRVHKYLNWSLNVLLSDLIMTFVLRPCPPSLWEILRTPPDHPRWPTVTLRFRESAHSKNNGLKLCSHEGQEREKEQVQCTRGSQLEGVHSKGSKSFDRLLTCRHYLTYSSRKVVNMKESRKALATLGEDSFKLRTSRTLNLLFLSLLAFMRTQFQSIILRVSSLSESESHCWSPWMVRQSPQDFPEAQGTEPETESHDEIHSIFKHWIF